MPVNVNRKLIFDAAKQLGAVFKTQADVAVMDLAIDAAIASATVAAETGTPAAVGVPQFKLGEKSKHELEPVHPALRRCVERAITYTPVDFRVNQGLRTLEEQKKAVASGNSRTLKSKHLRQADGFVWAVDLVALRSDGKVTWEFAVYAAIAWAMDKAATELGLAAHIRWGCAWDRVLADFGGDRQSYLDEATAYAKRHAGSDLLDAPHFEWVP